MVPYIICMSLPWRYRAAPIYSLFVLFLERPMPGQKARPQTRPPSLLCTTRKSPGRLLGSSPPTSTNQVTFNNKYADAASVWYFKGGSQRQSVGITQPSQRNIDTRYLPTLWMWKKHLDCMCTEGSGRSLCNEIQYFDYISSGYIYITPWQAMNANGFLTF